MGFSATKESTNNYWFKLILFGLLLLTGLVLISQQNYLLFHAVIELFTIVVGGSIFVVSVHARRYMTNQFFVMIGVALLFVSGLDLLHSLAYKGMGILPAGDANPATQLWIAARYLHAIALIAAVLCTQRRFRLETIFGCYASLFVLLLWSIFSSHLFPVCFVEGQGLTTFKKISELAICGFFAAAIILLQGQRERFSVPVFRLLILSSIAAITAELSFIFYVDVYGFSNLIGHIFKLISFACLYSGVLRTGLEDPLELMFRDLQQSKEELEQRVVERTEELTSINTRLNQEIMERKKIEADLAEQTMFLKESQAIARVGGWKSNPVNDMLYWTEELYRLFEHPVEEPVSHTACFRYFDPQDLPMMKQALQKALEDGTPFRLSCRMLTNSGRRFWADFNCVGRLEEPDGSYIAGTIQDITEHKQIEELLTNAKEMAEATSRTKTQLLSTLSHELRTPLNGVICGVQLLEMEELSEEQTEYLQMVKQSAAHELRLVNDLLDLAGLEASGMQIEAQLCNLREGIHQAISVHCTALEERGLVLQTDLPDNLERMVIGDGLRLTQIVSNLIGNAIKFTEQGIITVAAEIISTGRSTLRLLVRISDTGIGINPDDRERIFDPFVQVDMSNTRRFGGTGLGLAICHRLVERMGGTIRVDSMPGEGSCFTLELPFQLPDEEITPAQLSATTQQPVWNGPCLNVLIAEDNQTNLLAAAGLIRKMGLKAICAEDGKLALAKWLQGEVDVILMDIQMPVMDGREATRFIRQREQDRNTHTPIIALTAHAMAGDRERFLGEGFDGYIPKPFQLPDLVAELKRVTGKLAETDQQKDLL